MTAPSDSSSIPVIEGFPRPDWSSIAERIGGLAEGKRAQAWDSAVFEWLEGIAGRLPSSYEAAESERFFVLAALDVDELSRLVRFAEASRRAILDMLPGIAADDPVGKHVVLLFDDHGDYYRYISYFYPAEGEFGFSGGVFIDDGYPHISIPYVDPDGAERTLAHELTHACLRHQDIPKWVDEGLAVTIENELCGTLALVPAERATAPDHWTTESIQGFWSGESFSRPDELQALSYELARLGVRSLQDDYEKLVSFVQEAEARDAGEAAARQVYGVGLSALVQGYLGAGDWTPRLDVPDE